jgi:hypothetical protein
LSRIIEHLEILLYTRIRKSPFFYASRRHGVAMYAVYNHMYHPRHYGDPVEEYWRLLNGVTLWDVGVERQVGITGPDAFRFTSMLVARDLTKCQVGQCKYVFVTAPDGGIINDPVLLRLGENHFWLSLADSDVPLWARGVAHGSELDVTISEPDVGPRSGPGSDVQGRDGRGSGSAAAVRPTYEPSRTSRRYRRVVTPSAVASVAVVPRAFGSRPPARRQPSGTALRTVKTSGHAAGVRFTLLVQKDNQWEAPSHSAAEARACTHPDSWRWHSPSAITRAAQLIGADDLPRPLSLPADGHRALTRQARSRAGEAQRGRGRTPPFTVGEDAVLALPIGAAASASPRDCFLTFAECPRRSGTCWMSS